MQDVCCHGFLAHLDLGFIFLGLVGGFRHFQFDEVQKGVGIAGKYSGAAGSVHAALLALAALGMMVAVDHRCAQLGAYPVKLIAESGHLVGAVFVAGDNFIDRVDDDGDIVLLHAAADQLRCQFIHGHCPTSQIPNIHVGQVSRFPAQRLIYIPEPVQTACPIQFQIDIHHPSFGTGEAKPRLPFGNGDGQLYQGK